MKCPKCGNERLFYVAVSATADYNAATDCISNLGNPIIDDRETATCELCNYAAAFEEFENKEPNEK